LNVCFDALLLAGGDNVFRSIAHAKLEDLANTGLDFSRVVRAHLLNKPHNVTQPHPGLNQSVETLELYRRFSENGAFRKKAERFRGDYEWVAQDLCLSFLSTELNVGFFKLTLTKSNQVELEAKSNGQQSTELRPVHSPDFRSVNWFGQSYEFTTAQAECV